MSNSFFSTSSPAHTQLHLLFQDTLPQSTPKPSLFHPSHPQSLQFLENPERRQRIDSYFSNLWRAESCGTSCSVSPATVLHIPNETVWSDPLQSVFVVMHSVRFQPPSSGLLVIQPVPASRLLMYLLFLLFPVKAPSALHSHIQAIKCSQILLTTW